MAEKWEEDFDLASNNLDADIDALLASGNFDPAKIIEASKVMSARFRLTSPVFGSEAVVANAVADRLGRLDLGKLVLEDVLNKSQKLVPSAEIDTSSVRFKTASALHEVLINDK